MVDRVPLDSQNDRQHRTVIATATNELIKVRPPFDRTTAEAGASITPIRFEYPPGNPIRNGAEGDGSTVDDDAIQAAIDSNSLVEFAP